MSRRRNILDYKLREVLPVLGCFVLVFNIVGYLGGFLYVDFNVRYESKRLENKNNDLQTHEEVDQTSTAFQTTLRHLHGSKDDPVAKYIPSHENMNIKRRPTPTALVAAAAVKAGSSAKQRLSESVIQHSESCAYKSGRTATEGRWYNFSVPYYRFYAYSAFVDNRTSLKMDPIIRIVGIGTKPDGDVEETNLKLFCLLHYSPNQNEYVAMNRTANKIGYGWVLNNEWVREYIFTCPMIRGKTPRAISVVAQPGDVISSCMPVEVPVQKEQKEDFALCVQVAFDSLDSYRLVEWLELQWILGVRLVGIYSLSLDRATIETLTPYVKEGYVDLRKTDYIEDGPQQYLLHGSPVINDCIYRNMGQFNYVIVIDFDEVIVPKSHGSLRQMVDFLKKNYSEMQFSPVNYIFYNNYFFLDLSPDTSESPYLTLLRYRFRAPLSPFGYSVKSIVDTDACVTMHNHYCWTVTEGYANRGYPHVVDPSVAVNQHYKKCHLNETECKQLISKSSLDDGILRFKKQLKRRVEEKIFAIRGHSI